MVYIFYVLVGTGFLIMLAGMVLAIRLRSLARGGAVGSVVTLLIFLVSCFAVGYAAALFMPGMSVEIAWLMTAGIFFLGAIFVVMVLRLITTLSQKILRELEPR